MMKWVQRLIILLCILAIASVVPVRTDYGYFCNYTGSFKEWTTWFGLFERDYRYQKSKLEGFLAKNHASELEHKWVSFRGTTTFLLGGDLLAHGTPNPLFHIPREIFDLWCDAVSEDEKMKLYRLLRAGDKEAIREKTSEMEGFVLSQLR